MSERERKSKGEPARALPNLPKFLQGKAGPPPEKPPATPPQPIIPPIAGAAPAAKKPQLLPPVPAKPNQPSPPKSRTPTASPPPAPAEKKPVQSVPAARSTSPQPVAKTPPAAPVPVAKAPESPSQSTQAPKRSASGQTAAPASPAAAGPSVDPRPVDSAPAKKVTATKPTIAKSDSIAAVRKPVAPETRSEPVEAESKSSKNGASEPKRVQESAAPAPVASPSAASPPETLAGERQAGEREETEAVLDDVLPQAVSVSIVREAMAAEKAFRPILFAGPLKRVPKATPAETNGSAVDASNGASHPHRAVAEALSPSASDAEPDGASSIAPAAQPVVALGRLPSPARQGLSTPAAPVSSPTESTADAESDTARQDRDAAGERVADESASKSDADSVARERRKSKRRKAVSSVLLAAANRAKAASAGDADEQGDGARIFADPWERLRAAAVAPVQADGPTIRTEPEPDEGEITPEKIVRRTPPFAASLLLHVVLIVVLALIVLPELRSRTELELEMNYATEDSDLLEAIELNLPNELEVETTDPFSPDLSAMAADPLAEALQTPEGFGAFDLTEPAAAGLAGLPTTAFSSRGEGNKGALLGAFGGTVATQDAVKLGLGWMRRQQQPDGTWLMSGPYSNAALHPNKTAATAMALLCFFGDGHTPEEGEFRQTVSRGVEALLKLQNSDGDFYSGSEGWHQIYSQAQATIALCELYGMTRDEKYRRPAERAVRYCILTQGADGGWPHYPGQDSDTSVTGWYVMALKSGEMAGIPTPPDVFARVSAFLDGVQDEGGRRYKRRALDKEATKMMTAEAVLCREYLGWERNDPRLVEAAHYLLESPPATDEREAYYWYTASQALYHYGGKEWDAWNERLREVLPALQEKKGREQGSWNPFTDEWGARGGRLYMTALCLYTLEIYYRHLPLYRKGGDAQPRGETTASVGKKELPPLFGP